MQGPTGTIAMHGGQHAQLGGQQAPGGPMHAQGYLPPLHMPQLGYGEQWAQQQNLAQHMNTSYQGAQMQGMMGGPPAQHGYGPPPGYQGMPANATGAAYVPETPMPVHYQPQQGVGHPGHGSFAATHGMPPAPGAHGGMQPGVETTVQQGVAATEYETARLDGLAGAEAAEEGDRWMGSDPNRALFLLTCEGNEIPFSIEEIVKSLRSLLSLGPVPRDQIFGAMHKGGRTGPYIGVGTPEARSFIMSYSDTVTIFKSGADDEADFRIAELDEHGRTNENRERYETARAEREAARRSNPGSDAVRIFVDLPPTYMGKTGSTLKIAIERVQAKFSGVIHELAGGTPTKINFDTASSTEMDLDYNGFCSFVHFHQTVDVGKLELTRIKYLDDGASDMMIKCRIPRPNLEELGLVACCFRTQAECEGDRNQKGYCSRLDQAFDQRRAARKASRGGSSAEERELRNTMKAAQREDKKRRRLERGAQGQEEMDARLKKPCKEWKVGKCKRMGEFLGGKCNKPHFGPVVEGGPEVDSSQIPCQLQPCPYGEACPYMGPHAGAVA